MRRIKLLLASFAFVFALGAPVLAMSAASAAVCIDNPDCNQPIEPCNNDLAVSKQVKVPGGSFVDAPDAASAPYARVGDTVEWNIAVTKNLEGACEGTPNLHGTIVLHDVLPAGITYVSSLAGVGTYDSSTNDWSFTSLVFSGTSTIYLQLTTTANQVGSFENVATLSMVGVCIPEQESCEQVDYALGSNDPFTLQKDQVTENNSASAWVNIQSAPQVLGETTSKPQVLGTSTLVNTGSSTLESLIAGLFILTTVIVAASGRIFVRKQSH